MNNNIIELLEKINYSYTPYTSLCFYIISLFIFQKFKAIKDKGINLYLYVFIIYSIIKSSLVLGSALTSRLKLIDLLSLISGIRLLLIVGLIYFAIVNYRNEKPIKIHPIAYLLLNIVTLGVYNIYWLLVHAKLFKVSKWLVIMACIFFTITFNYSFHLLLNQSTYLEKLNIDSRILLIVVNLFFGVLTFIYRYHILKKYNQDVSVAYHKKRINPILTLFFGTYYLQHCINKIDKEQAFKEKIQQPKAQV